MFNGWEDTPGQARADGMWAASTHILRGADVGLVVRAVAWRSRAVRARVLRPGVPVSLLVCRPGHALDGWTRVRSGDGGDCYGMGSRASAACLPSQRGSGQWGATEPLHL